MKRNSITLADAQCLLWWSVSYVRETWLLRFKPPKMAFPSLCCLFRAIYQKLNNMLWIYRREYLLSLRFLTARRKFRLHNSTKTRSNAIRKFAQRAVRLGFIMKHASALTITMPQFHISRIELVYILRNFTQYGVTQMYPHN